MRDHHISDVDRRALPAAANDSGWTLTELMISMMIFAGLLAATFSILITVSRQTADNLGHVRQVDQLTLGMMQIDREVRSGNVISNPSAEPSANSGVAPGYSLRVYTQADGVFQCVQWRVIFTAGVDQGRLEFRSWDPAWMSTGNVKDWQVVARDLVDQHLVDATAKLPFTNEVAAGGSSAQSVRISLWAKDAKSSARSKASAVSSVLTGRNTVFGYPSDECAAIPPIG